MPLPSVLGERLLLARRRKGLSQRELGKAMELTAHSVGELERGKYENVGSSAIRKAAEKLGVTSDYLLGLTDEPTGYRAIQGDDPDGMPTGAGIVEEDTAPAVHAAALPRDRVCA